MREAQQSEGSLPDEPRQQPPANEENDPGQDPGNQREHLTPELFQGFPNGEHLIYKIGSVQNGMRWNV